MKFIHFIIVVILTIITQIGGLVYLATILLFKKYNRIKIAILFISLYLLFTFLLTPQIAPFFGRVKIKDNTKIEAHTFITKLLNRNYVSQDLHDALTDISLKFDKANPSIKIIYLNCIYSNC